MPNGGESRAIFSNGLGPGSGTGSDAETGEGTVGTVSLKELQGLVRRGVLPRLPPVASLPPDVRQAIEDLSPDALHALAALAVASLRSAASPTSDGTPSFNPNEPLGGRSSRSSVSTSAKTHGSLANGRDGHSSAEASIPRSNSTPTPFETVPAETTPFESEELRALRRACEQGTVDAMGDSLRGARAIIANGEGAALWQLVETGLPDGVASLAEEKFLIALLVGSRASLSWLTDRPFPSEPSLRRMWLEGLVRRGQSRRAVEVLEATYEVSSSNSPSHTDALEGVSMPNELRLVYGEALCAVGMPAKAAEVLEGITVTSRREKVARALLLANARYHGGYGAEAKELLHSAERLLPSLATTDVGPLLGLRTALRLQLGLRAEHNEGQGPVRHLGVQGVLFRGFRLATSGRFRHATTLLQTLGRKVELPAGSGVLSEIMQGVLRITRGRYAGLDALSRELIWEAERLGNAPLYHWAFMLERLANLSHTMTRPELPWAPSIPKPTGIPARYLDAVRVAHAVRRGESVPPSAIPHTRPSDGPLVAAANAIVEPYVWLLAGNAARAIQSATHLRQQVIEHRFFFMEGEAVLPIAFGQLVAGDREGLARAVDALEGVAETLRSHRYGTMANLLRAGLAPAPDASRLLDVAAASDASPTAARVASVLLGGEVPGDALDGLLIDSIRASWSREIESMNRGTPRWVYDPATRQVYLPGRVVRASPLALRILDCLFEAGRCGEPFASLEEMARQAWSLHSFHPLRDSKRVHVAVRRLRTLIEEAPSTPSRLLTVEGGYALSLEDSPGRFRDVPSQVDVG